MDQDDVANGCTRHQRQQVEYTKHVEYTEFDCNSTAPCETLFDSLMASKNLDLDCHLEETSTLTSSITPHSFNPWTTFDLESLTSSASDDQVECPHPGRLSSRMTETSRPERNFENQPSSFVFHCQSEVGRKSSPENWMDLEYVQHKLQDLKRRRGTLDSSENAERRALLNRALQNMIAKQFHFHQIRFDPYLAPVRAEELVARYRPQDGKARLDAFDRRAGLAVIEYHRDFGVLRKKCASYFSNLQLEEEMYSDVIPEHALKARLARVFSDAANRLKETLEVKLKEIAAECRKPPPKKRQENGRFSHDVISILELWFQRNIERPYPDADTKNHLSAQTGLSVREINTW